ncbi:MAG: hypothetical protein J6P98_02975, partial [Clostridia bacterium]|nr:hypothetical protein [Clostridia bacterium]
MTTAGRPVRRTKKRLKLKEVNIKPKRPLKARITSTFYIYALFFLLLTGILFYFQVIKGPSAQRSAIDQWIKTTTVPAERGEITDSTGSLLATNSTVYKVLLWPQQISSGDKERVAAGLSRVLGTDYDKILQYANSETIQERVVKRRIDEQTKAAVEALKLGGGVGIALDTMRYYPMGSLLSQVIGYTDIDNRGQDGLEYAFNEALSGKDGKKSVETDSHGEPLPYGQTTYVEPEDGLDMVVTVNSVIQRYLEKALERAVETNSAKTAQGIVMDCRTGAILAMATKPGADLNDLPRNEDYFADIMRNRLVCDVYEPGSTLKILTLAAALDSGTASEDSSYYCSGSRSVNGETVHCWRHAGHGSQTLTQTAENSCNCAFMEMALGMGKEKLYDYLYAFGLGQRGSNDFKNEASGIV